MKPNGLTVKREKFLNFLKMKELGFIDVPDWQLYLKAGFSAKNMNSAAANACKLKKEEIFKEKMSTFREQLKNKIGDQTVADRLKEIITEGRDRESLSGIKEYNKIQGNYAPKDYNVNYNNERKEVFEGVIEGEEVFEEVEDEDDNELLEDKSQESKEEPDNDENEE